ncbi:hypothetical protein TeGR_g4502, partial [Tetraparma gracilis]
PPFPPPSLQDDPAEDVPNFVTWAKSAPNESLSWISTGLGSEAEDHIDEHANLHEYELLFALRGHYNIIAYAMQTGCSTLYGKPPPKKKKKDMARSPPPSKKKVPLDEDGMPKAGYGEDSFVTDFDFLDDDYEKVSKERLRKKQERAKQRELEKMGISVASSGGVLGAAGAGPAVPVKPADVLTIPVREGTDILYKADRAAAKVKIFVEGLEDRKKEKKRRKTVGIEISEDMRTPEDGGLVGLATAVRGGIGVVKVELETSISRWWRRR